MAIDTKQFHSDSERDGLKLLQHYVKVSDMYDDGALDRMPQSVVGDVLIDIMHAAGVLGVSFENALFGARLMCKDENERR